MSSLCSAVTDGRVDAVRDRHQTAVVAVAADALTVCPSCCAGRSVETAAALNAATVDAVVLVSDCVADSGCYLSECSLPLRLLSMCRTDCYVPSDHSSIFLIQLKLMIFFISSREIS